MRKEAVLQHLNNLATNYEQLAGHKSNKTVKMEKGHLMLKVIFHKNCSLERNGGTQARTLR